MECALLSVKYSHLNHEATYNKVEKIIDQISAVGGNFEMLWHNSELYSEELKSLYLKILRYACSRNQ